jgi:hypothetical protein
MATITSIYRYPVKGLSPEALPRAALSPRQTVPGDRLYAIENGPSGFDPLAQPYLPKQRFLMLMKNEGLARLRTRFDDQTHTLTIVVPSPSSGGRPSEAKARVGPTTNVASDTAAGPRPYPSLQGGGEISGDFRTTEGRAAIEEFFAAFCADELRGPPKILHAPGHSFSDVARKVVSFINLASVAAVGDLVGATVDPLRFRGNVYVTGWPAWSELDLVGKTLHAGAARLKIVKRIVRCAATNVDPATGIRNLEIPKALLRANGHADCGVYAEVIDGGDIATDDTIEIE